MVALAGKFAFGELTGILAAFREDINSKAVHAITFNALGKDQGWEDEQHKTKELL
jgi:hypothetical protein